MKYAEQKKLTKVQQDKVRALLEKCREYEAFSLSFPMHEANTLYFLAEQEDGSVAGALALCRFDSGNYEILAFTDPELRRQGIFTHLWKTAKNTLPGPSAVTGTVSVQAAVEEVCGDAQKVLEKMGAQLASTELEMTGDPARASEGAANDFHFRKTANRGTDGTICYEAIDRNTNKAVFRSFILPLSKEKCYIHHVAVHKGLEGQGIGGRVFPEFMGILNAEGFKTVALQVSASNQRAVKMYEKAGLQISCALKYYSLPLEN